MQPDEGYVTTEDGVRLYFRILGEGPSTVLFPNGFDLLDDFRYLAGDRRLAVFDLRNRGFSDPVQDASKLKAGVHNDVEDLEAVRRHLGADAIDILGHSYVGLTVALYAIKHGARVRRVVQLGPTGPFPAKQYPEPLSFADGTLQEVFAALEPLRKERGSADPVELCRRFWSVLRRIYVADAADADRIRWGRCDLPNERGFMSYWMEHVWPSLLGLNLTAEEIAGVAVPVLTVHGMKDRSAPYGGGREWALLLPEARLVTVRNGAHAPWIEAPEQVFGAIETFLNGAWPEGAEAVGSLEIHA
jgi:pimeloyl-ACP methyl ester carboxylesterase